MKQCGKCREDLAPEAFSPSQRERTGAWCRKCNNRKNYETRNGLRSDRAVNACLWCGTDITDKRSHAKFCSNSCSMKHWRSEHPGRGRLYLRRCVYGLEPDAFDAMLAAQQNACAICSTSFDERRLTIDHCHDSGAVRGLLCDPCNNGLGRFSDNPELLRAAASYLER